MTDQPTYSKDYNLPITQAQKLRFIRQEYKDELEELANARTELTKHGDKMKNSKAQKELKGYIDGIAEDLKDAPPQPYTPDEILESRFKNLYRWRNEYEKEQAEFVRRVRENPMDALIWRGDDVIKAQVYHSHADYIIKEMEACESKSAGIRKGFEILAELRKSITTDIINKSRWGFSNGGMRNVVEQFEHKAKAEFLEDMKWIDYDADRVLDGLTSWELTN